MLDIKKAESETITAYNIFSVIICKHSQCRKDLKLKETFMNQQHRLDLITFFSLSPLSWTWLHSIDLHSDIVQSTSDNGDPISMIYAIGCVISYI